MESDIIARIDKALSDCEIAGWEDVPFPEGLLMECKEEIIAASLRWIPVEEELPEIDQNVLACDSGEVGISQRYVDGWYWDVDEWHKPFTPTHWQPLPEPPEVKR